MPNGLGIDQSHSSTGFALWVDHNKKSRHGTIKTTNADNWIVRQQEIVSELVRLVEKYGVEYVAVEDYAYGTFGRAAKNAARLCELGGAIKHTLLANKIMIFVVNTKYVKQWIGVAHNAKKKEVVAAVNKRWGYSFKIKDNDMADALILAEIADSCWARLQGRELPKHLTMHQRGLVEAILGGEDTVLRV